MELETIKSYKIKVKMMIKINTVKSFLRNKK